MNTKITHFSVPSFSEYNPIILFLFPRIIHHFKDHFAFNWQYAVDNETGLGRERGMTRNKCSQLDLNQELMWYAFQPFPKPP